MARCAIGPLTIPIDIKHYRTPESTCPSVRTTKTYNKYRRKAETSTVGTAVLYRICCCSGVPAADSNSTLGVHLQTSEALGYVLVYEVFQSYAGELENVVSASRLETKCSLQTMLLRFPICFGEHDTIFLLLGTVQSSTMALSDYRRVVRSARVPG